MKISDNKLKFKEPVSKVREILLGFEKEKSIFLFSTEPQEVVEEICGNTVNLGFARNEFPNSLIGNIEFLKAYLSEVNANDDDLLDVEYLLDEEQTILRFLDLPLTAASK